LLLKYIVGQIDNSMAWNHLTFIWVNSSLQFFVCKNSTSAISVVPNKC